MEISEHPLYRSFAEAGQSQVFRYWPDLTEDEQAALLEQAQEVDLNELESLIQRVKSPESAAPHDLEGVDPAPYVKHWKHGGDSTRWKSAASAGAKALRAGKVAAFTVAGGQGTRLGFDGPKGTFPVTPLRKAPLFQVFAEKIRAANERYDCQIPWFIMTSHANHDDTIAFFEKNRFFELEPDRVHFFRQGRMPAVDFQGNILLAGKGDIAMTPDGHGGSLRALVRSGAVDRMRELGIEVLSYFQVDNPLVKVIDPEFIGFHLEYRSEMSSKMIPKREPSEKLGHFCQQSGHMVVIEYSDMPEEMQEERDDNGNLRFLAGSIAIHILSVDFVSRIGRGEGSAFMPFHLARKKVPHIDEDGKLVKPDEPNGYKFEMFVFDALPFARAPLVIETLREDDFSPVKNAEGEDSPETARIDQLKQWTRWVKALGVTIPADKDGVPKVQFEISPLYADTETSLRERWFSLPRKPEITDGTILV